MPPAQLACDKVSRPNPVFGRRVDERILLSGPDVGMAEREALLNAFDNGWIAPVGPELLQFEADLVDYTGAQACVALASGTAALHLALLANGVKPGDEVVVQSATFAASAFAVAHAGAVPIFCDSEWSTWCLDPSLLHAFLLDRAGRDALPQAVMPVDLYGSTADYTSIVEVCAEFGVIVVRDAAEALGSISSTGHVGELPMTTALSFNGNKIITTSSGGALLGDAETIEHTRYLATQARQPVLHYEHVDIGFNYRMSNLLAALGSAQLAQLEQRIARRNEIFERYLDNLPMLDWCAFGHTPRPNRWLSAALLPHGVLPADVCERLSDESIEARPGWKPMHRQPIFAKNEYIAGDGVADALFDRGICLPTGSALTDDQVERVISAIQRTLNA